MTQTSPIAKLGKMSQKIGVPGGPLFIQLMRHPGLYAAGVYALSNPHDASIQAAYQEWRARPAVQQEYFQSEYWIVCLHWFYKKKFDSRHKVPYPFPTGRKPGVGRAKTRNDFEPIGEILRAALDLVEYAHLYGAEVRYLHHWGWFSQVAWELQSLCFDVPEDEPQQILLRRICDALRDSINPFDESLTPHLYRLVGSAYRLQKDPTHRQNITRLLNARDPKGRRYGFIHAIRAWATKIDQCPELVVTWATPEGIHFNEGRGRGRKLMSSARISAYQE
jgi:hypothetical protein